MLNTKNKFIFKEFISACLLIFSFSIASSVHAALVPCGLEGKADCTLCHLVLGFKNIYDYLLYTVLLPATTLVVVIAGVMYMVSSGNKGMIEKAKSALTYALTAMILALTAWLIINATLSALGYTKVDNWYTFTCDTTQTKGATGGAGTTTTTGTTKTTGTGSGGKIIGTGVVTSGEKTLDQVASSLQSATTYVNYSNNPNGLKGWVGDKFYGDCSSWAQEFYKTAYGVDPGRSTKTMLENANVKGSVDVSTLKAGDLLITTGSGDTGRHASIFMNTSENLVISNSGTGTNVVYSNVNEDKILGVIKAPS